MKKLRWPGIEPGSNAWKASMLTITPPTLISKSTKLWLIQSVSAELALNLSVQVGAFPSGISL